MKAFLTVLLAIVGTATAVSAHPPASARLATCGAETCMLLRGYRASAEAIVGVNGRPIDAKGGRTWQALLPVETVRDWSPAFARTVRVTVEGSGAVASRSETVRLPIGLLGAKIELASLVVHAR